MLGIISNEFSKKIHIAIKKTLISHRIRNWITYGKIRQFVYLWSVFCQSNYHTLYSHKSCSRPSRELLQAFTLRNNQITPHYDESLPVSLRLMNNLKVHVIALQLYNCDMKRLLYNWLFSHWTRYVLNRFSHSKNKLQIFQDQCWCEKVYSVSKRGHFDGSRTEKLWTRFGFRSIYIYTYYVKFVQRVNLGRRLLMRPQSVRANNFLHNWKAIARQWNQSLERSFETLTRCEYENERLCNGFRLIRKFQQLNII